MEFPCARNINAVIRAKQVGDQRWWVRNRQIIDFLDQGKPVREIAILVGSPAATSGLIQVAIRAANPIPICWQRPAQYFGAITGNC